MASKSKRLNFSVLERDILLRLIEKNIEIVESKKNDGLTVRRKDAAWARIVAAFNAEHDVVKRTHRQLRKYWNNLKMRAKKSTAVNGYSTLKLPTAKSPAASSTKPTGAASSWNSCGVKTTGGTANDRVGLAQVACANTLADGILLSSLVPIVVKNEPNDPWSPLQGHQNQWEQPQQQQPQQQPQQQELERDAAEHFSPVLEAGPDEDEAEAYSDGRSNGEVENGDGEYGDILDSDAEDMGEVFGCESDSDFRHETADGHPETNCDSSPGQQQWTSVDYARSEHEAKMALLAIQMETAHEQRQLAREIREQTRKRFRLEIQVLEEKRRYRRMKMKALYPQGHSMLPCTHEPGGDLASEKTVDCGKAPPPDKQTSASRHCQNAEQAVVKAT
ncbi:uncharacterized protein LOC110980996 [Acanthaster planci]|uniref:Uncharacterized protein LOC110980996 n=1 Tax=Acanthaster planci TaxID=133434 RepID=A0A8B7YMX9_ACAPL|nr:uncharacterized protein LOC110980996 [Acanthaster planci]